MRTPSYVANFDSATAMLRATAACLRGEDLPALGAIPRALVPATRPVTAVVNALPRRLREEVYARASSNEAIRPGELGLVSAERLARWAVGLYPRRRYPAVAVGSSGGALVHLYAALGIPWLPQTFLVPVKNQGVPVDEPRASMGWGERYAPALLEANPEIVLHHMHDPNQDRLTLSGMAYFRVKRTRLGEAYERFLKETLESGGTLFLVECRRSWPTMRVGERHVFQHGALGGATVEEFFRGGERVANYLARYGSYRRRWDPPEPDGESPEAEWGFEPALGEDVERFARERGYRVRRVVFDEPEHPSPLVAELYRWWYRRRGLPADRLLVESFIFMEPYWALGTGSVPFWMKFNMEPSLERVEGYLDEAEPYDEIRMMLFSHGVESVGLPSIERWRGVLKRARRRGAFVGVDERKFPRDFASQVRYHAEVKKLGHRPTPEPLALQELEDFVERFGDRYPVRWL